MHCAARGRFIAGFAPGLSSPLQSSDFCPETRHLNNASLVLDEMLFERVNAGFGGEILFRLVNRKLLAMFGTK